MSDEIRFSGADARRLGAKLEALDLTDAERRVLLAVLERVRASTGDEVEGHALFTAGPAPTPGGPAGITGGTSLSDGFHDALQPFGARGFGPAAGGTAIILDEF